MSKHILHIARVVEVNGAKAIGELETNVSDLYRSYKSRKYAVGQVGSLVRIDVGNTIVFGIVTSLRMREELIDGATKTQHSVDPSSDSKWIEIELFGQGEKNGTEDEDFIFQRGISTYPLPGQGIRLATVEELKVIYAKPNTPTVKVGSVAQVKGLPAYLLMDELLGKHFAILGTTGSGKSCTVALVFQSILKECPYAHIVLLDPHNEYPRAFPDQSESIDPTKLQLPHWLLNFEESLSVFIGMTEHEATRQNNILKDAILNAKKIFPSQVLDLDKITIDSAVPYKISDVVNHITEAKNKLTESKQDSHLKILNKIETLKSDKRFSFLLRPDDEIKDNLHEIISDILRIPGKGKPISIIDLSGIPSDVVDVVVSVLCRLIFDFALWNEKRIQTPLFLVCEEAHRYVPKKDEAAFQPTKQALSRIAKEGRKYGVGLCLVTQRASELSETILSQCNTIIALRMTNQQDQDFVRRALPDNVSSLVNTLPALQNREALVVGEGTIVPLRVFFDEIEESKRPKSSNVAFAAPWKVEITDNLLVKETIKNWREQNRVIPTPVTSSTEKVEVQVKSKKKKE
ncbi:MAG: DUF87 domain-containing protein [Candidatus Paceibacterota bacterium]|jgi:hypothetical protein